MTDPIFAQMSTADPLLGQAMDYMLQCLITEANRSPNPPLDFGFRVGAQVVQDIGIGTGDDQCCRGLGYVSLLTGYPTEHFPRPDILRHTASSGATSCPISSWAFEIQVGLIRCLPVGDMHPLPNAAWEQSALQQVYDTKTLRRAGCCFRTQVMNDPGPLWGMSVLLRTQTAPNPQGGCIERNMIAVVQIPNDCDC